MQLEINKDLLHKDTNQYISELCRQIVTECTIKKQIQEQLKSQEDGDK